MRYELENKVINGLWSLLCGLLVIALAVSCEQSQPKPPAKPWQDRETVLKQPLQDFYTVYRYDGCKYLKFGTDAGYTPTIHSETCPNPKHSFIQNKEVQMSQNQNPAPTEVVKLIEKLSHSKPFYIAALLECTGDEANNISEAFDDDSWPSALLLIGRLPDKALSVGVQKMKEAQ